MLQTASTLRRDTRLWTGVAQLTGAAGNSTGLVADAMVEYYRIGIDHFLIRGFEPLADAEVHGRDLIPLVRAKVAALEEEARAVA